MTASQTDPQIWIVVAILIAVVAFACAMSVIADRCQSIGPTVLCVLTTVLVAVIGGAVASSVSTPARSYHEPAQGQDESEAHETKRPLAPIDI